LKIKKGVFNQETCQEHNGEAKSPKIPCYGNDSSLEELKPRSRKLSLLLIVSSFHDDLYLRFGSFSEATQKVL